MDSLIKQTRARFAAGTRQESKEEGSSTRDRKTYIPPQRTQPFREKKRSQSWIRRQFSSGQMMSWDHEFSADYPTAVAAAAYAIHQSLEESESIRDHDKRDNYVVRDKPLRKIKSREKDTRILPEPLQTSLKPNSDDTSNKRLKDPDFKVPISMNMPEETMDGPVHESINRRLSFSDSADERKPESPVFERPKERAVPVARRSSTFADQQLNITDNREAKSTKPKFDQPFTKSPTSKPVETRRQDIPSTRPGPEESMAAAWEKEEMASIKERYEKLKDTIDHWEANKKRKARQTLEKKEGDPSQKKREKAFKNYHEDIARIEGIAGGARAQAAENRRKEEYKVKEKANKIRSTGKIPATCFCF